MRTRPPRTEELVFGHLHVKKAPSPGDNGGITRDACRKTDVSVLSLTPVMIYKPVLLQGGVKEWSPATLGPCGKLCYPSLGFMHNLTALKEYFNSAGVLPRLLPLIKLCVFFPLTLITMQTFE